MAFLLDTLIYGIRDLFAGAGAVAQTRRSRLWLRDGFAVTDDPTNERTIVDSLGSTPTGTGLRKVVAGVEDAAASLLVNADVDAAAAIALSKTALSANAQAWLTTPTSANLRTLVSDETGTGALYFAGGNFGAATGTSVVLTDGIEIGHNDAIQSRTSGGVLVNLIKIQTSGETIIVGSETQDVIVAATTGKYVEARGDTFRVTNGLGSTIRFDVTANGQFRVVDSGGDHHLTFAVPNLAAARTLNVPLLTGNDTFVTEAHTQTLDAKTLTGVPYLAFSGTVPATGTIRLAVGNTIKSVVGGTDRQIFEYGAGAELIFGEWTNGGPIYLRANSAGEVRIQINSDNQLVATASLLQVAKPRVGFSVPYASEGEATESTDANTTLAASVYSRVIVRFNGAYSAVRTYTFPHPASADASYVKHIRHTGSTNNITISTGTGTTASIAPAATGIYAFTTGGVALLAS